MSFTINGSFLTQVVPSNGILSYLINNFFKGYVYIHDVFSKIYEPLKQENDQSVKISETDK